MALAEWSELKIKNIEMMEDLRQAIEALHCLAGQYAEKLEEMGEGEYVEKTAVEFFRQEDIRRKERRV